MKVIPIEKKEFGFAFGKQAYLYTMKNESGMTVTVTDFGGALVSIETPDKNGKFEDVILGYDDASGYEKGTSHQGGLIGRIGNRIAAGKFTLDGKDYQLDLNDNGVNHLHGGNTGYDRRFWNVKEINGEEPALVLSYFDPDGTENYPGNVLVTVTYTLTKCNAVKINYKATTDAKTIINLTNHTYFNLNGFNSGDILDHYMQIFADYFTPSDSTLIPTGEKRPVGGTVFDFRQPKKIGKDVNADDEQLILGGGYDHNFVTGCDKVMKHVAHVYEENSGRMMDVYSDQPAMQLYIGNFLDGENGKNGSKLNKRWGFCLETQHTPNTPNLTGYPKIELNPGEVYDYTTVYRFSK